MKALNDSIRPIAKVLFCFFAAVAFVSATADNSQHASYNRVPFTAEYIQTSTNCITGTSFSRDMFWAVRSDGARSFGLSGVRPLNRTVTDPVARRKVEVSDAYKLKSTYDFRLFPVTVRRFQFGPNCCPPGGQFTYVGEDTILGYRAYHYLGPPLVEPLRSEESHLWFAPDLNCHKIQDVVYMRNASGTLTNIFEERPARIRLGEPDPGLFDVPEDYREVKPSEFSRTLLFGLVQQQQGFEGVRRHVIPPSVLKTWALLDEQYESTRKGRIP